MTNEDLALQLMQWSDDLEPGIRQMLLITAYTRLLNADTKEQDAYVAGRTKTRHKILEEVAAQARLKGNYEMLDILEELK